jgi:Glycosyl hydrolase family 76
MSLPSLAAYISIKTALEHLFSCSSTFAPSILLPNCSPLLSIKTFLLLLLLLLLHLQPIMRVLQLWLTVIVLAISNWPAKAMVLDVDDPSEYLFLASITVQHLHPRLMLDSFYLESIRDAAATAAYGLQALYNGNKTGGVLGKWPFPPYYWWESGAAWGGMVNYWHYTQDNSYVNVTYEAIVSQIGPTNDFMLPQEKFNTVVDMMTCRNMCVC